MGVVAAIAVICAGAAGAVLTLVGLPGMWVALAVAVVVRLWQPDVIAWWVIGIGAGLAVLGELAELLAGAAGAGKAGGSKRAAVGATIGGIVGAIVGTIAIPIPVLGTIIGSVVGAGLFAALSEPAREGRRETVKHRLKVGGGAAGGRLVATVVKTGLAVCVGLVLAAGAVWGLLAGPGAPPGDHP